jgi:methylamine utilization protein MauE
MQDITVRIAAGLLGAVFAWAGIAKLVRWTTWRTGLRRYRLGRAESAAAVTVPVLELMVVAGLIGGFSLAAAALTLALLAGFCLAVLRARSAEGDRLPCNCFGADSAHDYRTMLLRNGLLGIPAAVILLSGEDFFLFGDTRLPSASEAIPVALVGVGVLLGAWMIRAVATMTGGEE